MAHLVALIAVLFWSGSFLAAARLRQDLTVAEALAARFIPVFVGSGLLLLWRRPRFARAAWPRILALGLCGVVLYNIFFFLGLGMASPYLTPMLRPGTQNYRTTGEQERVWRAIFISRHCRQAC